VDEMQIVSGQFRLEVFFLFVLHLDEIDDHQEWIRTCGGRRRGRGTKICSAP
jgi:hypothetical protein